MATNAPTSSPKKTTAKPAASSSAKTGAVKRASASLSHDQKVDIYRMMVLIRRFEETVIDLFREGVLPGFLHVAIGQEAIAAGSGMALDDGDYIGSTHRAHGHVLARGSDPQRLLAEMLGKVTGVCRGKGGSMHISDMSRNVVGANGVVGAGAPMMTGVALTQKMTGGKQVAVAYYGDGASNQGNVHEALNLAQLWKLPVLFILENNGYAESTPYWQQVPVKDIADRGKAYDMKTISVDGNDVLAVYDATSEAAEYARSGRGPVYLVAHTKRIVGHYVGDSESYRPKGEAKEWKKGDPLPRYAAELIRSKAATQAMLDAVSDEIDVLIEKITAEARAADAPAAEEAMIHVYAEDNYPGPVLGL